jgi:hypothetical protein
MVIKILKVAHSDECAHHKGDACNCKATSHEVELSSIDELREYVKGHLGFDPEEKGESDES